MDIIMKGRIQAALVIACTAASIACRSDSPVEPPPAPEFSRTPISSVRVTSSAEIAFVGSIVNMDAAVSANAGTEYTVRWSLAAGTLTAAVDSVTGVVIALAAGSASVTACATASLPNGRSQPVCGETTIKIGVKITDVASRGLSFVQNGTIFVAGSDGSDPAALAAGATRPAWSPDGARIVFTRSATQLTGWQVCTVRSDGADIRCAIGATGEYVGGTPSWSPDGKMVAFTVFTYQCGNGQCGPYGGYWSSVLVLNTTTMNVKALDTPPVISVSWSPDGRKIAVVLARVGSFGRGALGTVSTDGSRLEYLAMSLGSYSVREATWSPDSRRLALLLNDENACPWYCDTAIGVVNADATNLKLLDRAKTTEQVFLWGTPVWSPDGASVAYTITKRENCFMDERVACGTEVLAARVEDGAKMLLIPNGGLPSWRR